MRNINCFIAMNDCADYYENKYNCNLGLFV